MRDDLNLNNNEESADRGMPSINQRGQAGSSGIIQKITIGGGALVVILALVAVNGGFSSDKNADDSKKQNRTSSGTIDNHLGPAPGLPEPPLSDDREQPQQQKQPVIINTGRVPPPVPSYPDNHRHQKNQMPTPQERKSSSDLFAFNSSQSISSMGQSDDFIMSDEERAYQMALEQTAGQRDIGSMMMGGDAERADGLKASLEPTQVQGARASLIADRNMFVTKGTFLDCALETAISSDVPGMTSCRVVRDIYSTSGKVLLLERGSRITGQYKGGLQKGKARIFVLWNRIETPTGVIVNLDSPGTDALGRSGHTGFIDTHFWQRFGGAIMLSFIDDVGTYVVNEASESTGGNQVQFGGTAEAAKNASSIALENSINIPSTLVKHQGDHISVFVARDLDFRGVYDLKVN